MPRGVQPREGGVERVDKRFLPPGTVERRVRLVTPLFRYAADHGINMMWVMRRACERRGVAKFTTANVLKIKVGKALLPDWLIPECCAVIGRPVSEIMGWCGPEWAAEFGAEYGIEPSEVA